MSLDCVIYCAFYSILFREAVFFRTWCSFLQYLLWFWQRVIHCQEEIDFSYRSSTLKEEIRPYSNSMSNKKFNCRKEGERRSVSNSRCIRICLALAVTGLTIWNSVADELRTYFSDDFKIALKKAFLVLTSIHSILDVLADTCYTNA